MIVEKLKKLLLLLIVVVMMFSLTGCNNTEDEYLKDLESKYYYNQLESGYKKYGKNFYKKLYENKEKLKKGNYKIIVMNMLDKSFKDFNSDDKKYAQTSSFYAKIAFLKDNPDVFWVDSNKLLFGYENAYFTFSNGENENYFIDGIKSESDVNSMETKISESISGIMKELDSLNDDYSKIKRVHDYLCETITYDNTANYKDNIYGALVEKKCVCEGYAAAFQYFMNNLGIESITVVGEGYRYLPTEWTANHAWNYVKLNGAWYAVDTTWDDGADEGISYDYFLKGNETMSTNHSTDKKNQFFDPLLNWKNVDLVSEKIDYPNLSKSDYQ